MKSSVVGLLICLVLLMACNPITARPQSTLPAASTAGPGALLVNPELELGLISPYIYGTNYGPMHAVSLEMLPLVLETGITALRWPGGAWGDSVDMKPFQIDQFKAFWEMMNATPTISVRLLGGEPKTAAELVRYANIEKGYGIIYWSIGNEPTLFESQSGESYDTVRFNQEWRAIAEAMKAVDPTIKLMGPELHQWGISLETTPKDSAGRDWMIEFLKANGDLVDVVTVHRYPLFRPGSQMVTVQEMRENTNEWPLLVSYLRGVIHEITGRDLPVAFTEVNSSPTATMLGTATPDSFYNAIWYADVIGKLIEQDVFMVNQWVLSQRSTGLGLIYGNEVRPTLYVFQMYKNFGNQRVASSSGVEDVNIYAARREDGLLTVMVINLSDDMQRIPLSIEGWSPASMEVQLLDSSHNAEVIGQQPWPGDGIIELPAQSVTLLTISK